MVDTSKRRPQSRKSTALNTRLNCPMVNLAPFRDRWRCCHEVAGGTADTGGGRLRLCPGTGEKYASFAPGPGPDSGPWDTVRWNLPQPPPSAGASGERSCAGAGKYGAVGTAAGPAGGGNGIPPCLLGKGVSGTACTAGRYAGSVGAAAAAEAEERKDYKTTLQEIVQRRIGQQLTYHMVEESGPDHNKTFLFEVRLNGEPIGRGGGHSKKEAEQAAARDALERQKQ